ncbi:dual specificity protein phosphatase 1 [Striga asiatica]|uniref:Dual specificity protein phosphatase 1 n=1 Tax=Striga asiatica TaxID=4170 RepID=A0A5A7PU25_STRAF|nr:dual specificity protein phosphatase 1 [Striga asiatica]
MDAAKIAVRLLSKWFALRTFTVIPQQFVNIHLKQDRDRYDLKLLFDDAIQFLLESSLLEYYNIVFYSSSRIAYQLRAHESSLSRALPHGYQDGIEVLVFDPACLFALPVEHQEFMAEGESNEINYMYDTITLLI